VKSCANTHTVRPWFAGKVDFSPDVRDFDKSGFPLVGARVDYVAGAKVAAVVLGEVDAYLHAGGQYQWDSAAPVAVARAAGCRSTRLDGSPLRYNELDPMLPDLLVARTEFHAVIMATANSEL